MTAIPSPSAGRERRDDWLALAKGCRRRAHAYRRWAAEYPPEMTKRAEHYRKLATDQWRHARMALKRARVALTGESQ